MIKEGMIIQLLDVSIIDNLKKANIKLPAPAHTLFNTTASYYNYIHFNINVNIDHYTPKPGVLFLWFYRYLPKIKGKEW